MARDPSKTEDPTAKRLKKARGEGSVAKSQELPKAVSLLTALVAMNFLIGFISEEIREIFSWSFREGVFLELSRQEAYNLFVMFSLKLAKILLPVFLILMITAFIVMRVQVGHLWAPKVFKPKWGQIFNVAKGLQRLFLSSKTFINLGKNILMASAVAIAPYLVLKKSLPTLLPLFYATPDSIAAYILQLGAMMIQYTLVPMFIIAAADLFYTRWDYKENLKMTKQEIKDERKQMDGDPQIKSKRRQKMFEMMQRRMLADVPKADVVITNPTHYAIALRYNPLEAPAPIVLAKGVDHLALKIREIARENNVPIRENRPLAQALYKQVEVGDIIPEEMYKAVATILAQLQRSGRPIGLS